MKLCTVINCNTKHYAKKLCKKHYARQERNGHTEYVGNPKKKCKLCDTYGTKGGGLCNDHYYKLIKKPFQRQYMKKRIKNMRKNDINFRILDNLRRRLYGAIKSKHLKTVDTLGCSIPELKKHLEAQFQPGMNWENYGRGGWHIDHIKPLSQFNLNDPEELQKANNFKNLQPLWEADNIRKSNKILKY